MFLLITLAIAALFAALPAVRFAFNLRRYRPPRFGYVEGEYVAVLIPARNEAENIAACIASALASAEVTVELCVCDDASIDATASIVQAIAAHDPRVHLVHSAALPRDWNGKQHACWKLARTAVHAPLLLFLDADIVLHPWAIARAVAALRSREVSLLSGLPRSRTTGGLGALLLPLQHFTLLAHHSLRGLQRSSQPQYAAGSGQFLLVDRAAYFSSGGHAEIRASQHDGLQLPRAFREHGFRTDLIDLTRLATAQPSAPAATWNSLSRQSAEETPTFGKLLWRSLSLFLGQVAPAACALWLLYLAITDWQQLLHGSVALDIDSFLLGGLLLCIAIAAAALPRLIAAYRFKQPWWSALLHPLGVTLLLLLQWTAWLRAKFGSQALWRGRRYSE
ncbi:MAG: glycosyltransferase family A protein [Acidobacteriaceae bacterium]|nr:glycosyltransferase family A protein [Acidobacteriaceae bacterium]